MKNFRIVLLISSGLFVSSLQAQMWSVINLGGAIERGFIFGELVKEPIRLNKKIDLIKKLKAVEEDYNDRRTVSANFTSTPMMAATTMTMKSTGEISQKLEEKIENIKTERFQYGLKRLELNLANEKRYLDEIQQEYKLLMLGYINSGGPGYNYAAFLKVYIRILEIRRNVLALDNLINNLVTHNKAFKQ